MAEAVGPIRREFMPLGVAWEIADDLGVEPGSPFPLDDSSLERIDEVARQLEALWVDGRLQETSGRVLLPWEDVYGLDESEAEPLGLPLKADPAIALEVRAHGSIRSPEWGFRVKATHDRHGVLAEAVRAGPLFSSDAGLLLAPEAAVPLFRAIDQGVPPDLEGRLRQVGEVKRAATRCGADLDYYLSHEDVSVPEAVGLDVEVVSPEELRLRPVLEGEELEGVEPVPGRGGRTRAVQSKVDGNRRSRVVLDDEQRSAADAVRRRSSISGPDVPKFFANPEAFVPESVDLSRFSQRVRGLVPRTYTSQPYLRAESSGRDWFTVSAEVELAAEAVGLGPEEVGGTPQDAPASPGLEDRGEDGPGAGAEEEAPSISPEEYADLCRQVVETEESWVKHGDGWIQIEREKAERYLEGWDSLEEGPDGQLTLPVDKAGYVLDVISNLEDLVYSEGGGAAGREPDFLRQIPEYRVPSALDARLMAHQLTGYRWMRFLRDQRLGGLLADDMGLGKTVQVISFLAFLAEEEMITPTLLVLPSALIENWHKEIRRFCPSIQRIYHHIGSGREQDPARIARSQVVLTTYQTLRRDQLIMGQIDWQLVVSDEAQYVKNPTAQATAVLKAMKAKMRLALTGTPVENGLSELWCIVDFVQPGRLGSQRQFRDDFERPIRDASDESQMRALASGLQQELTPHYVRRVKEDILSELPPKEEQILPVPLGPRQSTLYGAMIKQLREGETIAIAALQRLIQICSHPEIVQRSRASTEELIGECPKLQRTLDLVEEIRAKDEKVLIFTHFKRMQSILQDILEERFRGHVPIINGEVAGSRRLPIVDRFNEHAGFRAMILAPQAAGVGLNITGANHVIHYTRLWNPAKENQATDRAHRLGQERPVTVYYPIVRGDDFTSVEERLAELLMEKRELARNVVWPRSQLDVSADLQSWLKGEEGA